jgi:hypothetical protein
VSSFVRRLGVAALFGAITLAASPALAQEVSLGYQWQRFSLNIDDADDIFVDDSITAPLGFNFDVAGPITDSLDIVGQVDWSRRHQGFDIFGQDFDLSMNFLSFAGGVRWSARENPSVTPYVHGLFGVMRSSLGCDVPAFDCDDLFDEDDLSSTDPMLQIGGGVAIPVGGWAAIGQLDYRRIFGDGEGVNGFRIVIGARFGIR